jgi:hypothetical protein
MPAADALRFLRVEPIDHLNQLGSQTLAETSCSEYANPSFRLRVWLFIGRWRGSNASECWPVTPKVTGKAGPQPCGCRCAEYRATAQVQTASEKISGPLEGSAALGSRFSADTLTAFPPRWCRPDRRSTNMVYQGAAAGPTNNAKTGASGWRG